MIKNLVNGLSDINCDKDIPADIMKFESPEDKLLKENRSLKYYNARLVRTMKEIRELGTAYDTNGSCRLSREARVAENIIFELGY